MARRRRLPRQKARPRLRRRQHRGAALLRARHGRHARIIDATQAAAFAARAAAVAAAGTLKGSFTARRPRATFADGSPLAAGDNARLTSTARGIDRIIRVTSRTDPWRGPVQIEFEAERGMFAALPPVVPDIRPDFGKQIPDEITRLRIWELPAALSGQFAPPEGSTMLAFLARKPLSRAKDNPDVTGQSVIGFQLQESPSGATYDIQGTQTTWAAAAKLTTAITAAAVTVTIDLDAQNLDLDSYIGQSAAQQANNTLLLIVGTEVMSVGTVTLNPQNGLRRTLAVLRGRLKTTAAAAAVNADAWLVFAEDITAWSHADWLPNSERWFKLLPYTPAATLNAEDADPIHYHFLPPPPSPPAATPPEIEFHTYSNTVETGRPFNISATITAPSEDIKTVITALILLNADGTDGPEQLLLVATPRADQRATFPVNLLPTCPTLGDYVVEIRVTNDDDQVFAERTSTITAGEPQPVYSWGNFTPSITTTENVSYSTRMGRWDSRSGWCRIHLQLVAIGATGTDNNLLTINLTQAGIPQSAWPTQRSDITIDGNMSYNTVALLSPITKAGIWGTCRAEYLTGISDDTVAPLLVHASNGLHAILFADQGNSITGIRNSAFGNTEDTPSLLDMTWFIPDPNTQPAAPIPYFVPSPPDLQQDNITYTQSNIYPPIRTRLLTIRVPQGSTLAGCRLVVKSIGVDGMVTTTRIDRTFTAADGDQVAVTVGWNHSMTGALNTKAKIEATLYSASGIKHVYTGNVYSIRMS